MALTELEIAMCHEISGIPNSATYVVHDGAGTAAFNLYSSNGQPGDEIATISQHFKNYLASVDTTKETIIRELVVEWVKVRLKTTSITGGSAGTLTQVNYSYEERRKQIKELFEDHVSYLSKWKLELQRAGSQQVVKSVPFIR